MSTKEASKRAKKAWKTMRNEKRDRQEINDIVNSTKVRGYSVFETKETVCILIKKPTLNKK